MPAVPVRDLAAAAAAPAPALEITVVRMAAPGNGSGCWVVAADGGAFAFGAAPFLGSAAPG